MVEKEWTCCSHLRLGKPSSEGSRQHVHQPTSTVTVATKPRKNGIFDNVDVTKRSLLFKCLRVARSHRENTAIPSTEGLSEGHCHNPLQNNGLKNGYSRNTDTSVRLKPWNLSPYGQKTGTKAIIIGDVDLSVACAHPLV